MPTVKDKRWTGPWIEELAQGYVFRFCVDGRAYIERTADGAAYCFPDHAEALAWLASKRGILQPRLIEAKNITKAARQQMALFRRMIAVAPLEGRDQKPPAITPSP